MVCNTAFVFVLQARDVFRIKDSRTANTFRRQQVSREWPQLFFQPFRDGNAKTFLTTTRHKWRQQFFDCLLQNVFRFVTTQLVVAGQ